jgi:hypothetical protein
LNVFLGNIRLVREGHTALTQMQEAREKYSRRSVWLHHKREYDKAVNGLQDCGLSEQEAIQLITAGADGEN